MEAEQPDWSLLPDRAREFFGLGEPFDATELKRAYTRLIRRFKPERAPAEFQRIRAAYEQLDERLRYGETNHAAMRPAIPIQPAHGAALEPIDAVALVRELGPAAAREKLRAAVERDPAIWSRLALIDDVLSEDPLAALRTLIEGVRATGEHPALIGLLYRLLHEDYEAAHASKALVELSEAAEKRGRRGGLPPHLYWFLTEHQWLSLASRARFDGFKALLARCARNVGEAGRVGELILLLRLRRRLALRADEEWLAAVDRDLSENLRNLPDWAESDYDYTLWLARYRDVRDEFRDAHPFRAELDAALAAIVSSDEVEADREFLRAQIACVERRDELFEAFATTSEADMLVFGILAQYAEGWRARRGLDEGSRSDSAARRMEFARRLDKRSDRSLVGRAVLVISSVLTFGSLAGAFLLGLTTMPWLGAWWWTAGVALAGLVVLAFRRGWFSAPLTWIFRPFFARLHRTHWRPLTAEFFVESRCSFEDLAETLASPDAPGGASVRSHVATDGGLFLFSLAVRSLD